jgi:hypothetical protein
VTGSHAPPFPPATHPLHCLAHQAINEYECMQYIVRILIIGSARRSHSQSIMADRQDPHDVAPDVEQLRRYRKYRNWLVLLLAWRRRRKRKHRVIRREAEARSLAVLVLLGLSTHSYTHIIVHTTISLPRKSMVNCWDPRKEPVITRHPTSSQRSDY